MDTAISPKVIRQRLFWRVLVILQCREFDLGVFGIGAMHRLAVMPQRLLRKPFWIARHFRPFRPSIDRKSTRLNSSHLGISYAVFCLKKITKSEEHTSEIQSLMHVVCRLLLVH